jgi:hypothetical protein
MLHMFHAVDYKHIIFLPTTQNFINNYFLRYSIVLCKGPPQSTHHDAIQKRQFAKDVRIYTDICLPNNRKCKNKQYQF